MRLANALFLAVLGLVGCIGDGVDGELPIDGEATGAGKADAASLTVTPVTDGSVSSDRRQSGGRYVLTSKNAWQSVLGTTPPASVDFSKEWVVFYGMGVQTTGGYVANVTGVGYDADDRTLIVSTVGTSPGTGCIVTQALTTPYQLVKFAIPSPRPQYADGDHEDAVNDCNAPSPSKLLVYRYGNQISASDFVLFSDGTIEHSERRTPTNNELVVHDPLTSSQLSDVDNWVLGAKTGTLVSSDGGPTTFGSSSGRLEAYMTDGSKVVIKLDVRDADGDMLNDVTTNTSWEAEQILLFVLGRVDRDLP